MGTSYIELNDKGFWMRDCILELWLRLLSLHIKEPTETDTKIKKIRDQWLLASRGYFMGCVPVDLEEFVSTEDGKKIVVDAINSLMNKIHRAPESLNKDVLNLIGCEVDITQDFETWRLVEVGEAFMNLIEGRIIGKNHDTEFMPGSKKIPFEHPQ